MSGGLPAAGSGGAPGGGAQAILRRFPYPYRAMLAVCSDLDETASWPVYLETARYLNSRSESSMGTGLGLEVGNTIYFDMPAGQFSYWNASEREREGVRQLIRSGHVDCLHSFGDLATTREHAGRALDDLARHGCCLEVWIDHGVAVSNFGADIMRGLGDVPGSPVYHADLSVGFGIRWVWRGRVTSVIGQGVPRRLGGVASLGRPLRSVRTVSKEILKGVLGRRTASRYAPHAANEVAWDATLRDGRPVVEFLRANPSWGGISHDETARGIGRVLTDAMLDRLIDRRAFQILYTHLGKIDDPVVPLGPGARAGFERLARRHEEGSLLVTTTRRLLTFYQATRQVRASRSRAGEADVIDLQTDRPGTTFVRLQAGDLAGVTIYTASPEATVVRVDGVEIQGVRRNPPDETGRPSVSNPWEPLEWPGL